MNPPTHHHPPRGPGGRREADTITGEFLLWLSAHWPGVATGMVTTVAILSLVKGCGEGLGARYTSPDARVAKLVEDEATERKAADSTLQGEMGALRGDVMRLKVKSDTTSKWISGLVLARCMALEPRARAYLADRLDCSGVPYLPDVAPR